MFTTQGEFLPLPPSVPATYIIKAIEENERARYIL